MADTRAVPFDGIEDAKDAETKQTVEGEVERSTRSATVKREATIMPVKDLDAQRNGTWVSCVGHIITAVIGSGVLYLPFFFDVLGWIGGMIMVLLFGWITWYTSRLLADAMVIDGIRYRTYQSAVEALFGRAGGIALAIVQYPNLILTAIAYNITGANSMNSFALTYQSFTNTPLCSAEALDSYNNPTGYCAASKLWVFCVIFGGVQLFMSQLPNLDSATWASYLGALMSFGYSFISLGMSIYQIATYGASPDTSVTGYPLDPTNPACCSANYTSDPLPAGSAVCAQPIDGYWTQSNLPFGPTCIAISRSQKVYDVFNAFGGIVFAFSFSFILIEISDTLKDSGRGPVWHMKRAVWVGVAIISAFYVLVSVLGYIAYGNELYSTAYVINLWVNPVFSQPVFAEVERLLRHRGSGLMAKTGRIGFRVLFRSLYVVCVCVIALCLPFFSDFVGLIGALGFWPATVLFPIEMYRRIHRPGLKETIWLEILNFFCFGVTVCAIVGSVQLIVQNAGAYKVFGRTFSEMLARLSSSKKRRNSSDNEQQTASVPQSGLRSSFRALFSSPSKGSEAVGGSCFRGGSSASRDAESFTLPPRPPSRGSPSPVWSRPGISQFGLDLDHAEQSAEQLAAMLAACERPTMADLGTSWRHAARLAAKAGELHPGLEVALWMATASADAGAVDGAAAADVVACWADLKAGPLLRPFALRAPAVRSLVAAALAPAVLRKLAHKDLGRLVRKAHALAEAGEGAAVASLVEQLLSELERRARAGEQVKRGVMTRALKASARCASAAQQPAVVATLSVCAAPGIPAKLPQAALPAAPAAPVAGPADGLAAAATESPAGAAASPAVEPTSGVPVHLHANQPPQHALSLQTSQVTEEAAAAPDSSCARRDSRAAARRAALGKVLMTAMWLASVAGAFRQ
eukprot:scaffold21.g2221.t1